MPWSSNHFRSERNTTLKTVGDEFLMPCFNRMIVFCLSWDVAIKLGNGEGVDVQISIHCISVR